MTRRLIIGISGASGFQYGVKALQLLRAHDIETHLVVSKGAEMTRALETDYTKEEVYTADVLMVIGTSLQVYPAAGLMDYRREGIPVFYIDPNPSLHSKGDLTVIAQKASTGVAKAIGLITP